MIATQQSSRNEVVIDLSTVYDPRRNVKQMEFHAATETYKLFGGAMGGGKALTPEHEVLTSDGWKFISDVKIGDSVLAWDQDCEEAEGRLQYAVVRGVYEQDYNGLILEHENRPYFAATPDHRWIVSWDQSEKSRLAGKKLRWKWVRSTDLGSTILIPASGRAVDLPNQNWLPAELELWGWYIAEGCAGGRAGTSRFSQEKSEGRKRIIMLLERLGVSHRVQRDAIEADWIPPLECGHSCYDKFIPREIMKESGLSHFIEGLLGGDGMKRREGWEYYTASKKLADDVQEIAIKLGLRATIYIKKTSYQPSLFRPQAGKGSVKGAVNYKVTAYPKKVWTLSPSKLNWREYRGKTYCLWIPGPQTFITRYKGTAFVTGNTAALINEGITLNLDYPGNFGLLMRKTWPSFRDTVLPQLERFLDRRLVEAWNLSEKLIEFVNGSRLRYGGIGDAPDDWQKFMSGEYGWIALDQAEEFTEQEFKMLSTRLRLMLPGIRYFFLLGCNPTQGWIKERFIERRLADHVFIPSLPTDNAQNLPADYIARMREILGDKRLIQALLEGNWDAVEEPDNVYAYAKVVAAMTRTVEADEPIELGNDVARGGDDETVIALREGMRVRLVSIAKGHDTMRTAGENWRIIRDELLPRWGEKLKKVRIKVDADGLGAGVVDRLKEQRKEKEEEFTGLVLEKLPREKAQELCEQGYKIKFEIVEIHGSGKPRQPAKFKNLRAEVHWALRDVLDSVALPHDPELRAQLLSIRYKINSAGQIEIVPKEEIKEKLGRSPDRAEGIIYALATEPPGATPRVWRA